MKEFKVEGMQCTHCQQRVHDAVAAVAGVDKVTVSLQDSKAEVEGAASVQAVIDAVENAGFGCEEC
ncbi:MAG: cation transporter [Sodaliphilus sp.]|nr:cation transporter [Sodaliphilus sp.]